MDIPDRQNVQKNTVNGYASQLKYSHNLNQGFNYNDVSSNLISMAIDAYVYGYPLVLMSVTERSILDNGVGMNQFLNQRTFPDPAFTLIVRPNVDTLYSSAWLDLREEPIILHVPSTRSVYYLMQIMDAYTNVFSSIGTRTTGSTGGNFAVVGPGWNGVLPKGVLWIQSPTSKAFIIGRTQTNGHKDYPIVHDLQDNYTLTPLSKLNKAHNFCLQGMSRTQIDTDKTPPKYQVTNMDAYTFFKTMSIYMNMNPPIIEDPEMNRKLAFLGLYQGKNFDFFKLNPEIQHALEYAIINGPKIIKAEGMKIFRNNEINNWSLMTKNIGNYGILYMIRAAVAMFGFGANLPQDAVYASAFTDKEGLSLEGKNNYVIHFEKGQYPPVYAFWSITLYNPQGFLAENLINRYAVGSHLGKLNYNKDGSLDIYVQNVSPGKHKKLNWLPAPDGLFNLVLRMYWPGAMILNREWIPPSIIKMNSQL